MHVDKTATVVCLNVFTISKQPITCSPLTLWCKHEYKAFLYITYVIIKLQTQNSGSKNYICCIFKNLQTRYIQARNVYLNKEICTEMQILV